MRLFGVTGVRDGGTVYIYSMFNEEVIVPMFDLHFRAIHVRGFWVSVWLASLTRTERQAALQVIPSRITYVGCGTLFCKKDSNTKLAQNVSISFSSCRCETYFCKVEVSPASCTTVSKLINELDKTLRIYLAKPDSCIYVVLPG